MLVIPQVKIEKEPENIHGQLMFREMYICAEYATPNFGRMQGNKICRCVSSSASAVVAARESQDLIRSRFPLCSFIDWKCQTRYDETGAEIVPRPKDNDALAEEHLEAWVRFHLALFILA